MAKTPDRRPGPSFEEAVLFDSTVAATAAGEQRYDGTKFSMFDASGEFDPRSGGTGAAFPVVALYSDQLDTPNNADWAVNAKAGQKKDTNNAAFTVRMFDSAVEEGVGWAVRIPATAANMKLTYIGRAETAPGAAAVVKVNFYERGIPGTVDAWSAAIQATDISIATDENWVTTTDERTIGAWGLATGQKHQFEWTRDATDVADTLDGIDFALLCIIVELS